MTKEVAMLQIKFLILPEQPTKENIHLNHKRYLEETLGTNSFLTKGFMLKLTSNSDISFCMYLKSNL